MFTMQKLLRHTPSLVILGLTLNLVCSSIVTQKQTPNPSDSNPTQLLTVEMFGQGVRAPTAAELAQERQYDQQQIALAAQRLSSQDSHQRIVATELLNAYQYPEAEQLLTQTLLKDVDPSVRTAAAQSLGLFKQLSATAQTALMAALQDPESGPRLMALDTLLGFAYRSSFDVEKLAALTKKLQQLLRTKHLAPEIHLALQRFIEDQQPVSQPPLKPAP